MDGFFAARFEAGDLGALIVGHVAEPADGAADFLEVQDLAMDILRLPGGHFFTDGYEVRAGGTEDDNLAALAGKVLQADQGVDVVDGGEPFGEIGAGRRDRELAKAESADGIAFAETGFPSLGRAVGGDEFGGVAAGIDDGETGGVRKKWVFGDGEEAELGFLGSGDDLDRRVLGGGLLKKFGGVLGDPESHGPAGDDFLSA